jgi:hypothetical protein
MDFEYLETIRNQKNENKYNIYIIYNISHYTNAKKSLWFW